MPKHKTPRSLGPDPQQVFQAANSLRYFLAPNQVTELRALFKGDIHCPPRVWSGYYDDANKLAEDAVGVCGGATGAYFIPNPVNPDLLARSYNRCRPVYGGATTSDRDILRRRFLLVDLDPVRPADISSDDAEHVAALHRAAEIRASLAQSGWPAPIFVDSGNGAHLDYFIDLPVDDGGLVAATLAALAERFDDHRVKVDVSVHNAARIWKLVGTYARKGDDIPTRPHRLATLIEVPREAACVTASQLQSIAGHFLRRSRPANSPHLPRAVSRSFDLDQWIARHGLDVHPPREWQGGRRWTFRVCPWNPEHTNESAYIVQLAHGPIAAGCHHNSCQAYTWPDLRELIEPGWRSQQRHAVPELPQNLHPDIARNIRNYLRKH